MQTPTRPRAAPLPSSAPTTGTSATESPAGPPQRPEAIQALASTATAAAGTVAPPPAAPEPRPPAEPALPSGACPLLARSPWARSLAADERLRLAGEIVERDFPAGATVVRKGDQVDAWIGVVEGLVKVASVSSEGKAVTFTGVPAGGWFGEGSLLKDEPRRYDVVALRDSRIAFMPRATFLRLLDSSIAFNRFLLVQLNERLAQFIATVEHDRLLGPEARVARRVAELFNPVLYPGGGSRLQISQEELGYLSGLSRQRVNQALHALERDGLLKVEYGGVQVADLEGLRRLGR